MARMVTVLGISLNSARLVVIRLDPLAHPIETASHGSRGVAVEYGQWLKSEMT